MMERWQQLAPRERLVLAVGVLLAIIIIGWAYIWSPLRDGRESLDASVREQSRQIVDLRRAANISPATVQTRLAGDNTNLLFVVDETRRPFGIEVTRSNPDGPDAMNVAFRDQRFDRLITWLTELEQSHGVAAVSASFTGSGNTGMVSGNFRLERF